MPSLEVQTLASRQHLIAPVLDELKHAMSTRFKLRQARALSKKFAALIEKGLGFVLLENEGCIGIMLYSSEYELRFSSFLSEQSAQKLPRNITICLCYVLEDKRDQRASHEKLLLKSGISRLRLDTTVETIAVQLPRLYEMDLEGKLAALGFLNCRRVRMHRGTAGRISSGIPPGCRLHTPTAAEAEELMSVIYHGYFAEIDGYLFPDISAVCSDADLFKEFIGNSAIYLPASVLARVQGYPSGCILSLHGETRSNGLIGVVAVVPGMRRRGIGRAMILNVLRKFQEMRYEQVSLAVTVENTPAHALYCALGFQEANRQTRISVWRRSISRPLVNFRKQ